MISADGLDRDVVLRDGSIIHVRAERSDDAQRIHVFYDRLAKESSYRDVYSMSRARPRVPPGAPPESRFVLVGELGGDVVAVAEYVVVEPDRGRAEVAFAVTEALQGRGVAPRLLELLAEHARESGVGTFIAQVLGTNHAMMSVLRDSGFDVERHVRDDLYEVSLSLQRPPRFDTLPTDRAETEVIASMRPFFAPRAVAVVGASRDSTSIGGQVFRNVRESGFRGPVHPVNLHDTMIDGVACVPRVTRIAGDVDLAIVAVPAANVGGVIDDCIAKQIPAVVVISAGFAEAGAEGLAREAELVEKVRRAGLRMIGPNCLGIMNTDPDVRLNAIFARRLPPIGDMAFACQGGSLGLAILDYISKLHIGISNFVSLGNKADVSSNDLVQLWGADPRTRVILLYLETFGNPRTFMRLARRVSREKPVIAVKAGRSLVTCGTDDAVADDLFRQAGIIRTRSVAELFDVATLLSRQPLPEGGRVAILTNSVGPGVLAADACTAEGLELPGLASATVATLRAALPTGARVANPVDMLVSARADHYRVASEALLADERVDSLLVIHTPPFVSDPSQVASAIDAAARRSPKPVLAVFMAAGEMPPALGRLPYFTFPEPAVTALAHVVAYALWRSQPVADVEPLVEIDGARARSAVESGLARGGGWLTRDEAQALAIAAGISGDGGFDVDTTIGALEHPTFGPVISLTAGEARKTFRLHPLAACDADAMIADVKRGSPGLRDVLLRVSALLEVCPEIRELDIHPVRVRASAAKSIDVRVRVAPLAARPPSRRIRY